MGCGWEERREKRLREDEVTGREDFTLTIIFGEPSKVVSFFFFLFSHIVTEDKTGLGWDCGRVGAVIE